MIDPDITEVTKGDCFTIIESFEAAVISGCSFSGKVLKTERCILKSVWALFQTVSL